MKHCENCGTQHDGSYGSGRFCSSKCARGFSTKVKRDEINKKVSQALKGKPTGNPFKKGNDPRRHTFNKSSIEKALTTRRAKIESKSWEEQSFYYKRSKVLEEQDGKCGQCGIKDWLGKEITLELHHKNGNNKDNSRENLIFLCPNCHSQTDNWRRKKIKIMRD